MSLLDGTFESGPCEQCGCEVFQHCGPRQNDVGWTERWARCCGCGATYDYDDLDAIAEAAEARRAA